MAAATSKPERIRLVLTDIDGTILPAGTSKIDARTMLAIRSLQKAGIAFGPSSGRDRDALFQPFWGDAELSDTGIFANGKVVYVRGRLVRHETLDRTETLALIRALHPIHDAMFNYFSRHGLDGRGGRCYIAVDCPPEELERICSQAGLHTPRVPTPTLPEDAELLSATVMAVGEPGRLDRIASLLSEACPGFDFLATGPYALDVAPRGVSKASALPVLCEHLGIAPSEILYLGDSDNDAAMMRALPNSVCMGNATDGAYAAARWCTGPDSADSVALILESLAAHGGELHPEDWTF